MTPTEIHQAKALGCRLVKLFRAVFGSLLLGQVAGALGGTLPFLHRCLASLACRGMCGRGWWGVDAIALGARRGLVRGVRGRSGSVFGGFAQARLARPSLAAESPYQARSPAAAEVQAPGMPDSKAAASGKVAE